MKVYLFGELIKEPVDHPMIRPSINAVAETYDIANNEPELASSHSSLTGMKVNRFLHIAESGEDLVKQNIMQRKVRVFNVASEWMHSIPSIRQPLRLMANMIRNTMSVLLTS